MKNLRRLLKEKCPWVLAVRGKLTRLRAFVRYYALIVAYRVRHPRDSVFQTIYRKHTWGRESRSGAGSEGEQTAVIKRAIPSLVAEMNVRSILDAACGDYGWMSEVPLDIDSYVGLDIVPEMVAQNQRRYGSERVRFLYLDITKDDLPRADLIVCRDCLVHMSYKDIFRSLHAFKASGAKYLLTTTYPGALKRHWNIATGMWRPLDLELAPFNFPKPLKLINENTTELTDYKQKSLGLWAIGDLPV
jgi:SAM-dependent methyltransferase